MVAQNLTRIALIAALAMTPGAASLAQSAQQPPQQSPARPAANIPTLPTQLTEEGQRVIYNRYTWQRRELAKRLPLEEPWPADTAIEAAFKHFKLDNPPVAKAFSLPAKIMTDIYLVNEEPNLAYLIDAGPEGLVLIDPGMPMTVDAILANVRKLGFAPERIKWVINTHAHLDHSMADGAFRKLGAKILVGRADAPAVEKGTFVTGKYILPKEMAGAYTPTPVDWPVDDGEELKLGNKTFVAIHTPGHTPGSTCFWLPVDGKNVLFGGDTLLFDYRLGTSLPSFADDAVYRTSLKKLSGYGLHPNKVRWDVLLPGHGTMVMDRAYVDVLKSYRQVEIDVANGARVEAVPFAMDYYRKLMFGRP